MNKIEMGKQRSKEVLGEQSEDIIKMFDTVSPDFTDYLLGFCFGDINTRKGFQDKYRELAVVACIIGQGISGLPLKAHLGSMLNVGWTKEEVLELIIFLLAYKGFPSCVEAIVTFKELIDEREKNSQS